MTFIDSIVRLFKSAARTRPPRTKKQVLTELKRYRSEQRAARRKFASGLTNRRTITFRDEDGSHKQVVAKKNGEWNYHYDRDWFPVRYLPAGGLKSALAAKGIS